MRYFTNFSGELKFSKPNREFEYLIFFNPPEKKYSLATDVEYSQKYLEILSKLNLPIPSFSNDLRNLIPWWRESDSAFQKLNRKSFAIDIQRLLKFQSIEQFKESEIIEYAGDYLFRKEDSFSGIGHKVQFNWEGEVPKGVVASKFCNRDLDLGHFVNGNTVTSYINLIEGFSYKGTVIPRDQKLLVEYLLEKFDLDLLRYQAKLLTIRNILNAEQYDGPFQVDSFITSEKFHHEICELNVRKTMSSLWINHPLQSKDWFSFVIVPKKNRSQLNEAEIILSPEEGTHMFSSGIFQDNDLNSLLTHLKGVISK